MNDTVRPSAVPIGQEKPEVYLHQIRQELQTLRSLLTEGIKYLRDAEKEIPERIRRFSHHAHSLHDMKYMYEELGLAVPIWLKMEVERIDDRLRQLLAEEYAEGGTINKVRREMASDPANRYDHTRLLAKPTHVKENGNGK